MMNRELHLFIIWSKAQYCKVEILEHINLRFKILGIHDITWKKENFSNNLTRFYGENLPKNSNKEKMCGNEKFTLIVVLDENPLYRVRKTSKGLKQVNVNMFDAKEMYRSWTGGGHKIHGTNSQEEARHDLILLTGYSVEEYIDMIENKENISNTQEFNEMPGEDTWKGTEEIFKVLNETAEYVVLRNFDGVLSDYNKEIHGDIDILCAHQSNVKRILNAKPAHKSKYRVRNLVKIGNGGTYIDLRYIGDRYYCAQWEQNILDNRCRDARGFYRPADEDYIYALIYHAIIQKKDISEDYLEIFLNFFPELESAKDIKLFLYEKLNEFMSEKKYIMEEPSDYSVYFDEEITGKRMSAKKAVLKAIHKLLK